MLKTMHTWTRMNLIIVCDVDDADVHDRDEQATKAVVWIQGFCQTKPPSTPGPNATSSVQPLQTPWTALDRKLPEVNANSASLSPSFTVTPPFLLSFPLSFL